MLSPILIVDDEAPIRMLLKRILTRQGYAVCEAANGREALAQLQDNPGLRLVLTDLRMPLCGGIELIKHAHQQFQRLFEFIVLTGDGDKQDAVEALRLGVREFLDKPVPQQLLISAVRQAQERLEAHNDEQPLGHHCKTLRLQQVDPSDLDDQQFVQQLALIAQYRDVETAEHCIRVGQAAAHLAALAGQDPAFQQQIRLAAILHDIGKIGIPDAILYKPGRLDAAEMAVMQTHSEIGFRMLNNNPNPVFQMAAEIAHCHHERWDGSGYTLGLQGEAIPLSARLVAIADVYDALRSQRRYKRAFSHQETMQIMTQGDGRTSPQHFDPTLLALFASQHQYFNQLYNAMPDQEV